MQHVTCHLVNLTTLSCNVPTAAHDHTAWGPIIVGLAGVVVSATVGGFTLWRASATARDANRNSQAALALQLRAIDTQVEIDRKRRLHEAVLDCLAACDLMDLSLFRKDVDESLLALAKVSSTAFSVRALAGGASDFAKLVRARQAELGTGIEGDEEEEDAAWCHRQQRLLTNLQATLLTEIDADTAG